MKNYNVNIIGAGNVGLSMAKQLNGITNLNVKIFNRTKIDVQNIDLQESEIYYSKALKKNIETLGDKNADMQVTKFGANSQPYYFFIDANEKRLVPEGYGYDPDVKKFIELLEQAKQKFKRSL